MPAIRRFLGILIAFSVFILTLVFIDLLPFLDMQTEIASMNSAAISYETTYSRHKAEVEKLKQYSQIIIPGQKEIKSISDFFRNKGYDYSYNGTQLKFSGSINTADFTELMSLLQNISLVKIDEFKFENPISLPIQIGSEKSNTINIQLLELSLIQIDEGLLGG